MRVVVVSVMFLMIVIMIFVMVLFLVNGVEKVEDLGALAIGPLDKLLLDPPTWLVSNFLLRPASS